MSFNHLLPMISRCPICGEKLKVIVYGMLMGELAADEIAGGCSIEIDQPTKGCISCGWRGCPGGRGYQTNWVISSEVEDESSPGKSITKEISLSLLTATEEQLLEFGKERIEPRFELVHRGMPPEKVEDIFENDAQMPLLEKETVFLFYNKASKKIDQAAWFQAHWTTHMFQYVRPGFAHWETAATVQECHDALFAMKKPSLEVWSIDLPKDVPADVYDVEPSNFGSPAIQACLDDRVILDDELFKEGGYYSTPSFWPDWFDAGFMIGIWRPR